MEEVSWDPEIFSPNYWHKSASDLLKSANVIRAKIVSLNRLPVFSLKSKNFIEDSIAYHQSYTLLMGYSIENSLKGFAIEKFLLENKQKQISSFEMLENEVWKTKYGHDLNKLVEVFNLRITVPEDTLLSTYKQFILWAGKYHIPKNPKILSENTYKDKFTNIRYNQSVIKGLFKKIILSLNQDKNSS